MTPDTSSQLALGHPTAAFCPTGAAGTPNRSNLDWASSAVRLGRTFTAYGLCRIGADGARGEPLNADTLEEAVERETPPIMPVGDVPTGGFGSFAILETDETAREGKPRMTLHFYTVKVKRDWRAIGPCGTAQKAAIPYAVHAGSLPLDAISVRRPFSVLAGDDVFSGRQPGEPRMIEVRP